LETDPIIFPTYHWDVQDPLRCVEVIFGSGELFRTGDAVGPGDLEDQWKVGKAQSRGLGPANVDFTKLVQRTQGTLGIVTWASIGCRPLPKAKEAYIVTSEHLEPLTELTYKVMWRRLGAICLILNNCNFACILEEDGKSIERLREDLPTWLLFFTVETSGLYPDKKLEYQRSEFISLCQSFGLEPLSTISGISAEEVMKLIHGESPSAFKSYWKLRFKGGCQEVFFTTTLNRVPEFVERVFELAGLYKFATKDIGVYVQPVVQGTSCHCEFDLYYNPRDPKETDLVKNFSQETIRALVRMGAFFARPYPIFKDTIPYIAASYVITARKIKSIFDPNNIMNPGKLYFV
jgi:FAD/FMN-containing dehydrogenase